jgi:hypothetical protein
MNFFIQDPRIKEKSVSVTLLVISFLLCVVSLISSHFFAQCIPASVLSLLLFAFSYFMYRLRKVDEFSLNLKTGQIEAKDDDKKDV